MTPEVRLFRHARALHHSRRRTLELHDQRLAARRSPLLSLPRWRIQARPRGKHRCAEWALKSYLSITFGDTSDTSEQSSAVVFSMSEYPLIVGRYALFAPIASGGMASVHIGRLLGSFGFARTVAIKRLHQNMAQSPEFLAMFLDEARLAARIHHTNVVQTVDVVAMDNELLLVMDYLSGAALSKVLASERKAGQLTPHRVAVDIMVGVLNGLHAAHEAKNESGEPLHIVHRDVSPQNILVGTDGVARLLDFGIAKAVGGAHFTRPHQIKGKLRYLSPESITGQAVTRASDIYSASVVLWEMLAGRRLFDAEKEIEVVRQVLQSNLPAPSSVRPHISRRLDEIVMRGLDRNPAYRHATARDMALALEAAVTPVNRSAVSEWVISNVGDEIRERDQRVAQIEREVQGEGTAAAHRLQAGGAVSAENPVDQRTVSHASESGSAPSLSVETVDHRPRPGRSHRGWPLLFSALSCAALFAAGLWVRTRTSAPSVEMSPTVVQLADIPATAKPEPMEPAPSDPETPIVDPSQLPLLEVTPPSSLHTTSLAPKRPGKLARPAQRLVQAPPRKLSVGDRIYRRD